MKALNFFTLEQIRGIMNEGEIPANLDNLTNENRTQKTVQTSRKVTTSNGCHVTFVFPQESRPDVRRKIAEMFLTAIEKGMN